MILLLMPTGTPLVYHMGAVGHDIIDPFPEDRLKLAEIQIPPLTLFTVIVAGQLFLAVRTSKFGATRVLHLHVDLLRLHVEFDLGDGPRCC